MNKEQKAEVVEEVATQIQESEAVFAVDYRGISVPQAAELRAKLIEAGARFSVVKNTLTERAADKAGAETLKELLEGPTAFTFVAADGGDVALAAKALAQFRRETRRARVQGRHHGRRAAHDRADRVDSPAARARRAPRPARRRARLADHRPGARPERADRRAGDPARQIAEQGLVGGGEAPAEAEAPAEEAPRRRRRPLRPRRRRPPRRGAEAEAPDAKSRRG